MTAANTPGVDLDHPYHVDGTGGTAVTGYDDHVRDMIEQFLFTSQGERVNRPDFGSGLLHMLFAPVGAEVATALQFTVQSGLQRWLGDLIEVREIVVEQVDAALRVVVRYVVRRTGDEHVDSFVRGL